MTAYAVILRCRCLRPEHGRTPTLYLATEMPELRLRPRRRTFPRTCGPCRVLRAGKRESHAAEDCWRFFRHGLRSAGASACMVAPPVAADPASKRRVRFALRLNVIFPRDKVGHATDPPIFHSSTRRSVVTCPAALEERLAQARGRRSSRSQFPDRNQDRVRWQTLRAAPRPAAGLALHATGVLLPPTVGDAAAS